MMRQEDSGLSHQFVPLCAVHRVVSGRLCALHSAGELPASVFGPWWAGFLENNRANLVASGVKVPEKAESA